MDAARDIDVSDDYLLLSQVCEEREIPARWIALKVGRSIAQVYKYLAGEATIPSVVWRAVYERTLDGRVLRLVTGEAPVIVAPLPKGPADLPADLGSLIVIRKRQLACEEELLNILADNRVDGRDRAAIERYRRNDDEAMATMAAMRSRIENEYGKAVRA
jgi:hypothetical protein